MGLSAGQRIVLAGLLLLGGLCVGAKAQNCNDACQPQYWNGPNYSNQTSPLCYNTCLACYTWNCYVKFEGYFNGNDYWGYGCWCYIPWWGWLLISIGIVIVLGLCAFALSVALRS